MKTVKASCQLNSKSKRAFLKSSCPIHSRKDNKSSQSTDVPESQSARQPSCFSRVKLHCGTMRMWFVVTEERNLELQAVMREQLHWAKLPKGYFLFFFFFHFPRQNSCSYRSFRIFFFPVTGNPQALPLHNSSPLTLKYFQQTAFWMAVSTQNSILHLSECVTDSQSNCRYYITLPFSTFFHCLNSKNQYWSDNDLLQYHRLFAFSNYKLLFKTQEFMYPCNSRGDNFNVYFTQFVST